MRYRFRVTWSGFGFRERSPLPLQSFYICLRLPLTSAYMHSHKHGTGPVRGANGSYGGSARCSALSGVRALREFNPLIFPRGGLQNICKNVELNLPFGNSLKLHPLLNSPQRQVALHVLLIVNKGCVCRENSVEILHVKRAKG